MPHQSWLVASICLLYMSVSNLQTIFSYWLMSFIIKWVDGIPKCHSTFTFHVCQLPYLSTMFYCIFKYHNRIFIYLFCNIFELYWKLCCLDIMCGLIMGQTAFRYDLHSGVNDTIGNHDDIATSIGYSDETGKLLSEPRSWNFWTLHVFQLLF